jgi:plasmid maintenance system antidote protein VapI
MKQHPSFSPKELRAALVRQCGISAPYASQLVSGKRTPSYQMAIRIQEALGVSAEFWAQSQDAA